MNKEEALKLMEKKAVFNKNLQYWEKEYQAKEFIEKMENWSKEEILLHHFWLKNNILYWYKEKTKEE